MFQMVDVAKDIICAAFAMGFIACSTTRNLDCQQLVSSLGTVLQQRDAAREDAPDTLPSDVCNDNSPSSLLLGVLSFFLRCVRLFVTGGVCLSGLVCVLSPFMCLPEWWCPPRRSCLCLVSLHLSPFMCLPEWWCPPLRPCLCLVSLHVSP